MYFVEITQEQNSKPSEESENGNKSYAEVPRFFQILLTSLKDI